MYRTIITAVCLALAATLAAAPTRAQNVRSFVSGHGSDANPCSLPAPCRSFAQAISQTNPGGEIAVLDTAGYGAVNITKAISIVNPGGVEAGIATSAGGTAITVDAGANDAVALRGLTVEGAGSGATGIAFSAGQSLTIENCVIRNFTASGIAIAPTAAAKIVVTNTVVSNNGGHGIYVQPSGSDIGMVEAIFNRVESYNNGQMGIGVFGNLITGNSAINAIAVDSVAGHNNGNPPVPSIAAGYYVLANVAPAIFRVFRSFAFDNNFGVFADGSGSLVVSQSNLEGNTLEPWGRRDTGAVFSYGDNYTVGNAAPGGTPLGKN